MHSLLGETVLSHSFTAIGIGLWMNFQSKKEQYEITHDKKNFMQVILPIKEVKARRASANWTSRPSGPIRSPGPQWNSGTLLSDTSLLLLSMVWFILQFHSSCVCVFGVHLVQNSYFQLLKADLK